MRLSCCLIAFALGACTHNPHDGRPASFSHWQPHGELQWRFENGEAVASGSQEGFLVSEAEFGDFQLTLEFWVDATTNSGVFIRCQNRKRIYPDTCYELNIWDNHPQQEARTGAIVFKFMPPLAQVQTIGRWNTLAVTAKGSFIEVRVNEEITAVLKDADPAPGFLALQHWEEGTVRFRDLVLEPL